MTTDYHAKYDAHLLTRRSGAILADEVGLGTRPTAPWPASPRRSRFRFPRRRAPLQPRERTSNTKHEFLGGEIYAMAGGTPEHAALAVAVSSALLAQLRGGPCRVYSSDLRVRVLATGLATYPEVTVVCGPLERDAESRSTVLNPRLLVEVLSDSTEAYDRGEKLEHYRQIPGLEAVLLISHREPSVEVWERQPEKTWARKTVGPGEIVVLNAVAVRLAVDEIYAAAREPSV